MDAYDCEQLDRAMSVKIDAIYDDPTKHVFCSQFNMDEDKNKCGARGGRIRGRKTICGYCGTKKEGHAVDEQL